MPYTVRKLSIPAFHLGGSRIYAVLPVYCGVNLNKAIYLHIYFSVKLLYSKICTLTVHSGQILPSFYKAEQFGQNHDPEVSIGVASRQAKCHQDSQSVHSILAPDWSSGSSGRCSPQ